MNIKFAERKQAAEDAEKNRLIQIREHENKERCQIEQVKTICNIMILLINNWQLIDGSVLMVLKIPPRGNKSWETAVVLFPAKQERDYIQFQLSWCNNKSESFISVINHSQRWPSKEEVIWWAVAYCHFG